MTLLIVSQRPHPIRANTHPDRFRLIAVHSVLDSSKHALEVPSYQLPSGPYPEPLFLRHDRDGQSRKFI